MSAESEYRRDEFLFFVAGFEHLATVDEVSE